MLNKYIKQFMDDHDLKVGEKFKRKGDTTNAFFHFDEDGNLIHCANEITKKLLMKFLLGEFEVEKVKEGPWKPKLDEKYWFVSHNGLTYNTYNNDECDKRMLTHYLIFQTKEEAKDYKWFLDKVDEYKKPFENGEKNYFFCYDYENDTLYITFNIVEVYQGVIYFDSYDKTKAFVKEVGKDRIKKYMFGIYE